MSTRIDDTQLWQLWRPFVGIHRWFLHRGCPPTIRRLRGWTRIVHVCVLTGTWGLVSGMIAAPLFESISMIESHVPVWLVRLAGGCAISAITLTPLVRWLGSSWRFLLILPGWGGVWLAKWDQVSIFLLDFEFVGQLQLFPLTRHLLLWSVLLSGGALGQLLWIGFVRHPRNLMPAAMVVPIGAISAATKIPIQYRPDSYDMTGRWLNQLHPILGLIWDAYPRNCPLLFFQILLSITVGSFLWRSEKLSTDADR